MKILFSSITHYLLATSCLHATGQVEDLPIIRGKHVYANDTPSLSKAFPDLVIPKFTSISTANYKGYYPNTDKTGRFDNVTTIIFNNGKLTQVEFEKKVMREEIPADGSK